MNRFANRLFTASAALAAGGLILTGCGSGQVSQTADQESAVDGTAADVKHMALRNVHLQAVQTGDYLQPGRTVTLAFGAINESLDVNDKLVNITSDVGSVSVTGNTAIPADSALIVGDERSAAGPMTSAPSTNAEVTLSQPITNGLLYNFTFNFEKAGQTTVAVPVSAGDSPRQEAAGPAHG